MTELAAAAANHQTLAGGAIFLAVMIVFIGAPAIGIILRNRGDRDA